MRLVYDRVAELKTGAAEQTTCQTPGLPCNDVIAVHDGSLQYPASTVPSLENSSLDIRRGEAIGLVGPTGSGKSTLLDVLMAILAPTTGSVTVDGIDIQTHQGAWQKNLGYVPQSVFLIDASVRENIALGLEPSEVDDDALHRAVRAAELEPLLSRLDAGLDTAVGERGVRLSGGECQRIAIARALYNNPDILMMDEATSALDNTTEAAVVAAVEALKGDRTIIMIAHRLSTVRRCDRIVFLKHGRIDAIGTYNELLTEHADFRRMAEA